jgi:hypothetical protein
MFLAIRQDGLCIACMQALPGPCAHVLHLRMLTASLQADAYMLDMSRVAESPRATASKC